MALSLGKSFNRNYNLRIPFSNSFYDIGVFFDKKTSFLLFSVSSASKIKNDFVKINMFKNLESSKFCETYLELHQYRGKNLDIINQVKCIRSEQSGECHQFLNENLNLAKIAHEDKYFYDSLNIYGYTINGYESNFIFLVAERQHIVSKINKKIVRTTGMQIASSESFKELNDFHDEYLQHNVIKKSHPNY